MERISNIPSIIDALPNIIVMIINMIMINNNIIIIIVVVVVIIVIKITIISGNSINDKPSPPGWLIPCYR